MVAEIAHFLPHFPASAPLVKSRFHQPSSSFSHIHKQPSSPPSSPPVTLPPPSSASPPTQGPGGGALSSSFSNPATFFLQTVVSMRDRKSPSPPALRSVFIPLTYSHPLPPPPSFPPTRPPPPTGFNHIPRNPTNKESYSPTAFFSLPVERTEWLNSSPSRSCRTSFDLG